MADITAQRNIQGDWKCWAVAGLLQSFWGETVRDCCAGQCVRVVLGTDRSLRTRWTGRDGDCPLDLPALIAVRQTLLPTLKNDRLKEALTEALRGPTPPDW